MELHQDALFAGSKSVVRALCELDQEVKIVVPDPTCVHRLAPVGVRLLIAIRAARVRAGGDVAVVEEDLAADFRILNPDTPVFNTRGTEVARAQDRLLATYGQGASSSRGD